MALTIDKQIEELNELIRFDFDAIGAYNSAIDDIKEIADSRSADPASAEITSATCRTSRQIVIRLGGKPVDAPGIKGVVRKTMTKVAGLGGTEMTLKAMQLERGGAQQDLRAPPVARLPRRRQGGHPPATTATSSATWRGSSRRCTRACGRSASARIRRRRLSCGARNPRSPTSGTNTTRAAIARSTAAVLVAPDDPQRLHRGRADGHDEPSAAAPAARRSSSGTAGAAAVTTMAS